MTDFLKVGCASHHRHRRRETSFCLAGRKLTSEKYLLTLRNIICSDITDLLAAPRLDVAVARRLARFCFWYFILFIHAIRANISPSASSNGFLLVAGDKVEQSQTLRGAMICRMLLY